MPPTRANLAALFKAVNLRVPPTRLLDCLIFCRGKQMEEADPEEFQMGKLVQWFLLNLRTLSHISLRKENVADQDWLEENQRASLLQNYAAMPQPWRPHPKAFIRRGTGTGGMHYNQILRCKDDKRQTTHAQAFPEYGLAATAVAGAFDHQTKLQVRKKMRNLGRARQGVFSSQHQGSRATSIGLDFYNRPGAADAPETGEANKGQNLPVVISGHLRNAAYANIDPRASLGSSRGGKASQGNRRNGAGSQSLQRQQFPLGSGSMNRYQSSADPNMWEPGARNANQGRYRTLGEGLGDLHAGDSNQLGKFSSQAGGFILEQESNQEEGHFNDSEFAGTIDAPHARFSQQRGQDSQLHHHGLLESTQGSQLAGSLSARRRATLESDADFQKELSETVENLKRMPGFKNKVWERIVDMHNHHEQEKGERGLLAGQGARRRLQDKQRELQSRGKDGLENIILETSKTSALQAINLSQLLKKKWSEEKNAYVLLSKIKTAKQTRRLNNLLLEQRGIS